MSEYSLPWENWIVQESLGEGTFGMVFAASHVHNPQLRSAVKIISVPQDPSETEALLAQGLSREAIKRLYQDRIQGYSEEIQLLTCCRGTSHIVQIEDFQIVQPEDDLGGTVYIRMELLRNLRDYTSDRRLMEAEVIQMGLDISQALEACHGEGMIHQDIKPDNIFVHEVSPSGVEFKLGDFGSARMLNRDRESLRIQGSLAYAPPEILRGEPLPSSDLYSLGLTMYRFLNENRLPFFPKRQIVSHDDQSAAIHMRLSGMPLPAPEHASPALAQIILKACAAKPEDRYQHASEMWQALHHLQEQLRKRQLREKRQAQLTALWHKTLRVGIPVLSLLALLGVVLILFHPKNAGQRTSPLPTGIPLIPVQEKQESLCARVGALLENLQKSTRQQHEGSPTWLIPENIRGLEAVRELERDMEVLSSLEASLPEGEHSWTIAFSPEGDAATALFSRTSPSRLSAEFVYSGNTGSLQSWLLNFYGEEQRAEVSLSRELASPDESTVYAFIAQPEGLPRLLAVYDVRGNFLYAEMNSQRLDTLEALLEKGVMLLP